MKKVLALAILGMFSFGGSLSSEPAEFRPVNHVLPVVEDQNATIVLNNAEITDVLRLIAEEFDLNIVVSDEVRGQITMRLRGASLVNTLDAILISRGFDYEIRDNIVRVAPAEIIEAERNQRLTRQELEPLASEVVILRYLDANDVRPVVQSMLTVRGSVAVLEQRPFRGFQFASGGGGSSSSSSSSGGGSGISAGDTGAAMLGERVGGDNDVPRSNILMIVDVRSQIDRIKETIGKVDIAPRQVLIDTKILEVTTDTLEDIGITTLNTNSLVASGDKTNTLQISQAAGASDGDINPGVFTNEFPTAVDAGVHLLFEKLNGEDISVALHMLLQDERNKVLSSPRILTMENQEATILVGEQYPIFETNISDFGTATESLSYFQPIGISLQVICQVTPTNEVNMIIHPTVSSLGGLVTGSSGLTQPRINIREADTRVLIADGQTLVIGGLLADLETEQHWRIPILADLPLIGNLFTRRQVDVDQRNLLIFITPTIMDGDRRQLSNVETFHLDAIEDPQNYGFLSERRQAVRALYKQAKALYDAEMYDQSKELMMRVIRLEPEHPKARHYLQEMDALPEFRPLG